MAGTDRKAGTGCAKADKARGRTIVASAAPRMAAMLVWWQAAGISRQSWSGWWQQLIPMQSGGQSAAYAGGDSSPANRIVSRIKIGFIVGTFAGSAAAVTGFR